MFYVYWLGVYWLGVYPSWSRGSNAHNSFFCVKRGGGGVESQKQNKKDNITQENTRQDNIYKERQQSQDKTTKI